MKKTLLLLIATLLLVPARAVLTEKNLDQTLEVLNLELASTFTQLKNDFALIEKHSQRQHRKMIETMQRSNQVALMLYSQEQSYTFNLAYACHEAAQQYNEFTADVLPYDKIVERMDAEINRYEQLAAALREIPPSLDSVARQRRDSLRAERAKRGEQVAHPFMLDSIGQKNRAACLKYAEAILTEYAHLRKTINKDSEHYARLQKRLKEVFDYAQQRYRGIQRSIFVNGEDSYFTIISNWRLHTVQAERDWHNKYSNDVFARRNVRSEWRGPVVFGLVIFVTFYFVVAFIVSNVVVRLLMRKIKKFQEENVRLKTDCIIIAASFVFFAVAVMTVRAFLQHSFIIMASQLLVSFAWLTAVILISLIIRLRGVQIQSALRLYMPIVVLGFIVIVIRILFLPNSLVTLIFPPLLLVFTVWQWLGLRAVKSKVPASDMIYSWTSLTLMIVACVMAWAGYVLMAVQLFIWWLILLTLVQTITCVYDWLRRREEIYLKRKFKVKTLELSHSVLKRDGKNIGDTWFFDFVGMVLVPCAAIAAFLFSIYYAAEVFDLTEICINFFYKPFINITGICRCSVFMLVVVAAMFFLFNYIAYAVKAFYLYIRHRHLAKKNKGVGVAANQANISLFNNVTAIVVWGIYVLAVLAILRIPKSGLSYVSAGLATGVGFAMKSLIENFFYGISLMTGRLRMGDWIECDGVRGTVESITYQSTQIITNEGQVITFMNSTLFNKNFMNLTRNHLYEMSKIKVGVAYGTDINATRALLTDTVKKLMRKGRSGRDIVSQKKPVSVLVSNFGDSSIDLLVVYWTLVEEKIVFDCLVKEAIYNALNENHIEIPFPQRDVHIRSTVQS